LKQFLNFVTTSTVNFTVFNFYKGADLRNVCTEAGMFAIRKQLEYVVQDDYMKAARKVKDAKSLETKLDYQKV